MCCRWCVTSPPLAQNEEQVAAFLQNRVSVGVDAAISQDADPFDPDAPEGGVTLLM
jgi:hypothetical protein